MENLQLSLDSVAFNSLKLDFNQVLRVALATMEKKDSDEAKLQVDLKISFEKDEYYDDEGNLQEIIKPTFAHQVSYSMQIKGKQKGILKGPYRLVWDKNVGDYILKPLNEEQTNMFDEQNSESTQLFLSSPADYNDADEENEDTQTSIGDVIDADFAESDDLVYPEPGYDEEVGYNE